MQPARNHRNHLATITLTTLAISLLVPAARAANITWSPATDITSDANVSLTGSLVGAYYFTPLAGQPPTTINGVTFNSINPTGSPFTFGNFTLAGTDLNPIETTSIEAPFAVLSENYQTLLSSGIAGSTITLTLSGLTSGQSYRFEFWNNYSSEGTGGLFDTTATAGALISLFASTPDDDGGVGQFTVGTFTASGTSQTINFSSTTPGGQALINGFQLRVVPEPASTLLLGTGTLGLSLRRRRRA